MSTKSLSANVANLILLLRSFAKRFSGPRLNNAMLKTSRKMLKYC